MRRILKNESQFALALGDCQLELYALPDNSVDAVVTDPPYGLKFMGKKWDVSTPSVDVWREVLRVLKPGGHLLAFGGTRTYHRLAVAIEDAGFIIRDQLQWLQGQGFPKSLDISKAIDKAAGAERETVRVENVKNPPNLVGGVDKGYDRPWQKAAAEKGFHEVAGNVPITAAAAAWAGWGTNLKPANEPICLAMKPISEKTIAANVLNWGTGAINVDGCRIGAADQAALAKNWDRVQSAAAVGRNAMGGGFKEIDLSDRAPSGRFPANVLLDETAAEMLDAQSGVNVSRFFFVPKVAPGERNENCKRHVSWDSADQSQVEKMAALSQRLKDISAGITTSPEKLKWSTALFGSALSDQCQRGLTYTIETATKLITELKTSNCFQNLSISATIRGAIRTIEANGLSLVESVALLKKLAKISTDGTAELCLGARLAVLETLLEIKNCGRTGNVHATVKPLKLMSYLCRLITPPGGVVLDPFAGSGTTGVAALREGFRFIGCELDDEYHALAKLRIVNETISEDDF
jgi:DNA modification methylase